MLARRRIRRCRLVFSSRRSHSVSVTPPTRRLAASASAAKSLFAVPLKLTCRAWSLSTSSESAASPALSASPGPRASAALGSRLKGDSRSGDGALSAVASNCSPTG